MRKRTNLTKVDKFYTVIGKIVVLSGGFIGVFYLLNNFFRIVTPIIDWIVNFCSVNLTNIIIGWFVFGIILQIYANKKGY